MDVIILRSDIEDDIDVGNNFIRYISRERSYQRLCLMYLVINAKASQIAIYPTVYQVPGYVP